MDKSILSSTNNLPREDGYPNSLEKQQWNLRVPTCSVCFVRIWDFYSPKLEENAIKDIDKLSKMMNLVGLYPKLLRFCTQQQNLIKLWSS